VSGRGGRSRPLAQRAFISCQITPIIMAPGAATSAVARADLLAG
jgi:hypothetical protein